MVGKDHIDLLITAGLMGPNRNCSPMGWSKSATVWEQATLTEETATAVGRMLWAENARSIRYRYEDAGDMLFSIDDYAFTPIPEGHFTVVDVFQAISCFDYQACETPDWEQSEAWRFCNALRDKMIRRLPGYDTANGWDFTRTAALARIEETRAKIRQQMAQG